MARTYGDACLYRTPDGGRCAVGALIRDDEYRPEMDQASDGYGTGVTSLSTRGLLPARLVPHVGLLEELQNLHDDCRNWLLAGGFDVLGASEQVEDIAVAFDLAVPAAFYARLGGLNHG